MHFFKLSLSILPIVGTVFLGQINAAQAALLDFEGLPTTTLPTNTPVPESVLTDDFISDGVLFGKTGVSAGVAVVGPGFGLDPSAGNTVVGLDQFGNIPDIVTGDIFFSFVLPNTLQPAQTDFVSFSIGDGGADLDIFEIRAFDINNTLLQTQNFVNESAFPVSFSLPGINRIEVDFTGEFGYSFNNLNFNTPTPVNSVPEPQTILGLAAVLGMGSLMQRKASKRKNLVKSYN
ncbi:PEP-CTERM sorting domain-containing protein [Nostoc sp. DSM 114161]|jgi:hypothetical protein|uniref:PEP-CTERM sorting domain-containing protein n=1 Tax=Nostoc sp. DSM 114161 TaxID=3440143 RepID=UPI004045AF0F